MLMIAAALQEELETAKSLFPNCIKIEAEKVKLWQAAKREQPICFLKTGVGPKRSSTSLREALTIVKPSQILVVGYAGALDPDLKLGDLVAVVRALAFSLDDALPEWEHVRIDGEFELLNAQQLEQAALGAGFRVRCGDTMSSSHVLGEPAHKRLLFERFHASIVDMETAALARVAQSESIPLSCIRVVSDEARDTFLAPFSYNPAVGIPTRAMQLIGNGMVETYREWKAHSSIAKECLRRFLAQYL